MKLNETLDIFLKIEHLVVEFYNLKSTTLEFISLYSLLMKDTFCN